MVLGLTLLLSACGSSISEGNITAKVIEPGYWYTTYVYCGKGCMVPVMHYDDQDWRFDLSFADKTGYVYVTEETFDSYAVGDYWEDPEK